jgi:phenylpropionate dioxygenase-like ring-hydroxylating dioxygenase large terminal subunit
MAIETRSRYAELVKADAVHRLVYTDPAIFEAELQQIFARTWVFVGHESEVPHPGDYKTDRIARQPIVMTRHSDGQVRVLYNTCRHRGATVCQLPRGNATSLRCIYHGWSYNNAGELVGVPLRHNFSADFDPREYGLVPLPRVESYRGFLFASLSPEVPDLTAHLGRATHYLDIMIDRAPEREIVAVKPLKYEFAGNWKLQLENYSCNYHPAILHQSALDVGVQVMAEKFGARQIRLPSSSDEKPLIERAFGPGHGMADYQGTRGFLWRDAFSDPMYVSLLEARDGPERGRAMAETDIHVMIYPNLLLHHRLNHYRVIKPIAVDHTEINTYPCKMKGAPDQMNGTLVRYTSQHVSAGGEIQVDDLKAFAAVQEGLQAEAVEWIIFKLHGEKERINEHGEEECVGASELIQRGFYREWLRLMSRA